MNNKLSELLEQIATNKHRFNNYVTNYGRCVQIEKGTEYLAKHAMCFNIGADADYSDIKIIPELVRAPFDTVWIEYDTEFSDGTKGKIGVLWNEQPEFTIFSVWARRSGIWTYAFSAKIELITRTIKTLDTGAEEKNLIGLIQPVLKFFSAINCSNVHKIEHRPNRKLQRARAKRGKQPLFSTWTLALDMNSIKKSGENSDGSHASPRIHLRRGHARQYRPGMYCWVQPHVVGKKENGIVHKDYAVSS